MSFSVDLDLGIVGRSITGETIAISGCTGVNSSSECTGCTSISSSELVSTFPKIITGFSNGMTYVHVKVLTGSCSGQTQCIAIGNIPTPTPTPSPSATATPTPSPTATPTPTPTATTNGGGGGGGGGTTYIYYQLRPCDMQGQTGYLNGDYDVYSTGYTSATFNSGDRVEGSTNYFYVVVGSTTTDPGGTKYSVTSTGLTGCPEVAPPPTLRTAYLFAWSTASGPTLSGIKTDTCGLMPYQLPGGYTSLTQNGSSSLYVNESSITTGTTYTLYDANTGGSVVNGGNKWHSILIHGSGSMVFEYVAYITTEGVIQDWTLCSGTPPAPVTFTAVPSCVGYAPTGVTISIGDAAGGSGTGYYVVMTSPEGYDNTQHSLPYAYTGLDNYVGNTYAFTVYDSNNTASNNYVLTQDFSCAAAPNNTATVGYVQKSSVPTSAECAAANTYQVEMNSPSATFCNATTFKNSFFSTLGTGNNNWLCYNGQARQVFHMSGDTVQQAGSCQTI